MQFLKEIRDSVYAPDFYASLTERPFSYSFGYFAKVCAVLGLLFAVVLSAFFVPMVREFSDDAVRIVATKVPENFVFETAGGMASTSVHQPYLLRMPGDATSTDYLLVIDLSTSTTPDIFSRVHTLVFAGEDGVAGIDQRFELRGTTSAMTYGGKISYEPWSAFGTTTVTKAKIVSFLDRVAGWILPLQILMVPLFFIVGFFVNFAWFVYLILGAVTVWIVARVKQVKVSYRKAFQIGMHAVTLPILLCNLELLFGSVPIPFFDTLVFVAVLLVNLREYTPQPPLPLEMK